MSVAASLNPHHYGVMKSETFHIIGGGIAGLASAIAVANAGHQAIVLEKAVKFEAIGAGLQLGPNAVRALQQLGAWDAVSPITSSPSEIHIRNGVNGKTLKRIPLGTSFEQRFGMPYRVAHRADLVQALLDVAKSKPQIAIKTNAEILDHTVFENVIAADGVWSKTRESLFPGSAAVVTPEIFYRALLPNPNTNCVTLWLYPGGHVVHYPIGNPLQLNLVAITQGQAPLKHFANACDELKNILTQVSEFTTWPTAYVRPLKKWNHGNVMLIGDAAHGTLPYLAQGAAMALEDAAALSPILSNKGENSVSETFETLEKHRMKRTNLLHRSTVAVGNIYHLKGFPAAIRNAVFKIAPSSLFLNQQSWLYK